MPIRGFDQFASALNEYRLVLREVFLLQPVDAITGEDILSGENLVAIRLGFDDADFYLTCLGASDEIEISQDAPAQNWPSRNISGDEPWRRACGMLLTNAWQMANSMGYDDGVCLNFRSAESADVRILLESIASKFDVFEVAPSKA